MGDAERGGASAPTSSEVTTRLPQVSFLLDRIPPPSPLYIQRGEKLYVRLVSSVVGDIILIHWRMLTPAGEVIPNLLQVRTTGNYALDARLQDLTEGFLLDVTVSAIGALPVRGETYVQVGIARGTATNLVPVAVLVSDYPFENYAVGWPAMTPRHQLDGRGNIRIETAAPAAGAQFTISVTTGRRWRFQGLSAQLTTSATVANRRVTFFVDDGSNPIIKMTAPADQTASLTVEYYAAAYGVQPALASGNHWLPFPDNLYLPFGWRVRSEVDNMQAGDLWEFISLAVEEWIEF